MKMLSVSDLRVYDYCKRKLWLSRKAMIESGTRDFESKIKFCLLRSMTELVDSKEKISSFTDFMLGVIAKAPGEIMDTEVFLRGNGLCGSIDVLRRTKAGYIIQEEKMSDPPGDEGVWPGDLLQVDAYAFLVESNFQEPVVGGVIIYNDLTPRQVKPNPERAKKILEKATGLLKSNIMPEAQENAKRCLACDYYPLCQVLPGRGRITDTQLKNTFRLDNTERSSFFLDHKQLREQSY